MPPLPKEHGAWAVLYGPFLLSVGTLQRLDWKIVVLLIAVTAVFFAHEPLSKLVRSSRHTIAKERSSYWRRWVCLYLLAALMCGIYLVGYHQLWVLIPFGLAIGLLFIVHLFLIARRQERGVWGELIGAVGLTATAPAACYVLEGQWSSLCFLLWLLSFIYFSSGIFYVKMRLSRFLKVEERRKRIVHCIAYHTCLSVVLLLLSAYALIPHFFFLAYLPIIIRSISGIFVREERLNIRRIGYTEVAHTALFVVLAVSFWSF